MSAHMIPAEIPVSAPAPADGTAMQALRSIIYAAYRFQFLSAAFRFGLFELLGNEPGRTREEIAQRLGIQTQPARVLLLGCTEAGLLRKYGARYYNTPVAEPLSRDPEQIPGAFVSFEQEVNYRPLAWLYESLKDGSNTGLDREIEGTATTLYERLAAFPALEKTFHNMMGSVSRSVAGELVQRLDLSGYTHLLDIGGGTAVNATAFARRWKHLRVTIADLPTVAAEANARIAETGLGDRVRAVGLDAFKDEFPTGCDCVLFGHFLEIWSPARNRELLAKAARATGPGAGIFVISPVQYDDETGPEVAAALSAYFQAIASGEGMVYTGKEYEEWFAEAGFTPSGRLYIDGIPDVVVTGVRR